CRSGPPRRDDLGQSPRTRALLRPLRGEPQRQSRRQRPLCARCSRLRCLRLCARWRPGLPRARSQNRLPLYPLSSAATEPSQTAALRQVHGPSAFGGGRRLFFDLLWLISATEFRRTYFGTVLGYLWSLIRPLMLFAVLLFVFIQIVRVGSGVPHYPALLLL